MTQPPVSDARQRAREQAAAARAAQDKKQGVSRRNVIALGSVLGLAAIGGGAALVINDHDKLKPGKVRLNAAGLPIGFSDDGGLRVGPDDVITKAQAQAATHTVQVWFDYACPHCAEFEHNYGDQIAKAVSAGRTVADLRPVHILNQSWNLKAMNALAHVVAKAPDKVLAYHGAVFDDLYDYLTNGMHADLITDDKLHAIVKSSTGLDVPTAPADASGWLAVERKTFDAKKLQGTPTVIIDGTTIDLSSVGDKLPLD